MPGTSFTLRFALALALACFAVANGTGEQATPDSDTPLAPTGKDENRQLRTKLDQMKATEERHGKEIAKLKTLINANVQSEPRAANADLNARLLRDTKGSKHKSKSKSRPNGITNTLSTPPMLASCKKSWTFLIKGTAKTVLRACVQCRPDAPLPIVIGKHGKRLIWACDATRFKERALCEETLFWLALDPNKRAKRQYASETGNSAGNTCANLEQLIGQNDKATKLYSKHSQDLKLSNTAKLTSVSLYGNFTKSIVLQTRAEKILSKRDIMDMGLTRIEVEKTVQVAYLYSSKTQVFTVLSHSVRACGNIPGQPLQCLDTKQSKCIWSVVESRQEPSLSRLAPFKFVSEFKSGRKLPGRIMNNKEFPRDQPCSPKQFIAIATSRKL